MLPTLGPRTEGLYFRTTARFETGSADLQWFNHALAVGAFQPLSAGLVGWRFHAVL